MISGSIQHAMASLKANKRERKHFAGAELNHSIYTDPIVFKKSSKEVCKKAAKEIQLLESKENIRLGLVVFLLLSLVGTLLFIL